MTLAPLRRPKRLPIPNSACEEDFVDKMTRATRRQFQQPSFSPTGARRLLKTLKWTDG
jgi:hypothetical protein